MGKRLRPVLAFCVLLMPVIGHALGLGGITMKSALNQPLDADIELFDVQGSDLENLVVRLGSQLDFDRVGAERGIFLTKIKFEVVQKADGIPFVKATSIQTVVEPFLDFVVEARWPRGRVLREFTVLVDPPTLVEEAPAPVQRASAAPQSTPRRRVEAEPVERTIDDEAFFQNSSQGIQERAELAPIEVKEGELVYGPVKYSDTLWGIANQMRPSGVTVNQMMVALARQNPRVFYHGNVNQMKAGHVLRVNDREALARLSSSEADVEIRRQADEWQARKSGKLMQQAQEPTGGQVERDAGQAQAGAQGAGSATEDQTSLKLVAPGSESAASGAGSEDVGQLRQDLLLAAEALDANRQETDDLKARLTEMEEQLAAMQRLITLKDNEMATLQQQMSGGESAPAMAEIPAETMSSEEMASGGEAMDTVTATEEPAEAMMAEEPKPAPWTIAPQSVPAAPAPMEVSLLDDILAEVMAVVDDPMSILEKPMALYLLLGIVVLLLIGLLMMRRRSMQDGFEESILNVGQGAARGDESQGAPSMGESSMVSDFAMSEMSDMSGIQADAADVDPVSEADVYLAYGRHKQAEDIIREAIKETPDRHELRVKMLEIYFASKNRDAFETQANELHEILGDESDPLWARAVTMGHQLCPGNELFGGISADTLKEELASGVSDNDEDLLDFDFDLDSVDLGSTDLEDLAEAPVADSAIAEESADLDLNESELGDLDFDMADAKAAEEQPAVEDSATGLDFDVSSLDFNLDEDEDETDSESTEEDPGLEFTLDDETPLADEGGLEAAESEEESTETSLDDGLDFDLDEAVTAADDTDANEMSMDMELSDSLETEGEAKSELETELETGLDEDLDFSLADEATDEVALDLDIGEFSLDEGESDDSALSLDETDLDDGLDMDLGELSLDSESDDSEVLGDELADELSDDVFGEVDEVGTKLDLARAYVDMGDKDGARNILNEVVDEGNDEQITQAQELLGQID